MSRFLIGITLSCLLGLGTAEAAPSTIIRASVESADGHFVAFASGASNLVPDDTNGVEDIFVHDRQTGKTTRVSVDSSGKEGNDSSLFPVISADGRFVAFTSLASNLVAGDTNGVHDVFVHDRQTGKTVRVSVNSAGAEVKGINMLPAISADGRYITFTSFASDLVLRDTNGLSDIFVHDRQTGETTRVSVDSTGKEAKGFSFASTISADGRYVAFRSVASNLVSVDTNNLPDIFLHDRQTGKTTRVSVDSAGHEANGSSSSPTISADGRYISFTSYASNLVPDDTNGVEDIIVHDRQTGKTTRADTHVSGRVIEMGTDQPAQSDMMYMHRSERSRPGHQAADCNSH